MVDSNEEIKRLISSLKDIDDVRLEERNDLIDKACKDSFSKMYDAVGSLLGYVGYGFFIRKAGNHDFYKDVCGELKRWYPGYYVYRYSDCPISKIHNKKGELYFERLSPELGLGSTYFPTLENAKKFCLLKNLKNLEVIRRDEEISKKINENLDKIKITRLSYPNLPRDISIDREMAVEIIGRNALKNE